MLKQFLSDARKTTAIFTAAALSALPGASFGQDEVVIEPAKHVKAGEGVLTAEAYLKSIDGPGVVITIFPAVGDNRDFSQLVMDNTELDTYGFPPSVIVEPAGQAPDTSFVMTKKTGSRNEASGKYEYETKSSNNLPEAALGPVFKRFDTVIRGNHEIHRGHNLLALN